MRLGNFYITRETTNWQDRVSEHALHWFLSPRGQQVVARMARAEVKNYLAEIAEEAGMPFTGPEEFLRTAYRVTGFNPHTDPPELWAPES